MQCLWIRNGWIMILKIDEEQTNENDNNKPLRNKLENEI